MELKKPHPSKLVGGAQMQKRGDAEWAGPTPMCSK